MKKGLIIIGPKLKTPARVWLALYCVGLTNFFVENVARRQTIDGRGDIDVSHGQFSKIIKLFNSPAA